MANVDTNRNLVAALSYFLGFITGMVILFVEKDDKFVRFHAMQSTVIFGALFVVNIIIGMIFSPLGIFEVIGRFVETVLFIIAIVIWAVSMVKAYNGQVFKWPIAGKFAEKQVGR